MDLVKANIENLTSLWRFAGQKCGHFFTDEHHVISRVSDSNWPNKIWFHQKPDHQVIKSLLGTKELEKLTIATWGSYIGQLQEQLESCGFEINNELTGMSLLLDHPVKPKPDISLQQVTDHESAAIWSRLFQVAFGYLIHPDTVIQTMDKVSYYIGRYQEQNVGTAVLYIDSPNTAGIHSMGIVPEQRRKGFAEDLLNLILDIAKQKGALYATLQASEMGKRLYLRRGFQEDFPLKNFVKH